MIIKDHEDFYRDNFINEQEVFDSKFIELPATRKMCN